MRIFGLKLSSKFNYIHQDDYDCSEEECKVINPEKYYSSACHLYQDAKGRQYVGFELSLGMKEDEMLAILGKQAKVYNVEG